MDCPDVLGSVLSYLDANYTFAVCAQVCRLWRSVCCNDLDQLCSLRGRPPTLIWKRYKRHILSILSKDKSMPFPIESPRLTHLTAPACRVHLNAQLPSLKHMKVDAFRIVSSTHTGQLSFPVLSQVHIRSGAACDLRLLHATPCMRRVSIKRLRAAQIHSLFFDTGCLGTVESLSFATALEWPHTVTFEALNRLCPILRILRLNACMIEDRAVINEHKGACRLQNVDTLHLNGTMLSTRGMIGALEYFPNLKVLRMCNNPKVDIGQVLEAVERTLPMLICLHTDQVSSLVVRMAVRSGTFNTRGGIRITS